MNAAIVTRATARARPRAGLLFCLALASASGVHNSGARRPMPAESTSSPPATSSSPTQRGVVSPYHGMKTSAKAKDYYPAAWGADRLRVNYTSSGNLIRFTYRVVEPKLAKALADHQSTPHPDAPRSHAKLQQPTTVQTSLPRQSGRTEA